MSEPIGRNAAWPDACSDDDAADAESWQPLTVAEASALRARLRTPSLWWVPAGQVLAGAVMAALAWLVTGRVSVLLSALYGAAVVAVPAAVMVLGLVWSPSRAAPAAQVVRWAVWEAVKLLLAVGMLALAPRVVAPLSWPALLLALVVCLKVYWLALLWRGRWK
ncbi:ATP synthase subunit I [Immundisolibacter sp.]|uniref:ATP synthase subunit I n=1 Tax=Immundisolibacter sp. TaxID=1934948 RepID=UPI0026342F3D|nr:ATP synthase subunit I [Immundisolibacter sp.]MDD3652413.1 ATP synthase subunit I [Immundisolibacter sp.]